MDSRNRWLEGKRPLWIRGLLSEFHCSYSSFLEMYGQYLALEVVSFVEIERLVGSETHHGPLWRLKDNCHRLWREADVRKEMNGSLLDWVMGSLFHEAMKLKENAYISQYYQPRAEKMTPDTGRLVVCGTEFQRFMKGAAREIAGQMENLSLMFGRANYLLRLMMNEQNRNAILLRYLIENESVVVQLWSESLQELFTDMFAGAPEQGFCLAARSYVADHWQEQAAAAFARAREINPGLEEHCAASVT